MSIGILDQPFSHLYIHRIVCEKYSLISQQYFRSHAAAPTIYVRRHFFFFGFSAIVFIVFIVFIDAIQFCLLSYSLAMNNQFCIAFRQPVQ